MALADRLTKPNAKPVYVADVTTAVRLTGWVAALTATTVTATAASSSQINLSWTAVTSATGYYVYRSATSGGALTLITTTTSTSYSNTGLSSSTAYYYKVYAYNTIGTGPVSNEATATTLGANTYPSLADGNLVSAWLFDEGSGTTANDSVGTRHLSSVPAWITPGSIGYSGDDAVTFDGTNNISLAHDSGLIPNDISIYAWVKTTDNGSFRGIFDKGFSSGGYVLFLHNGYPRFSTQSGGGVTYTAIATTDVTDGNWHMIAATFNSATGDIKIYVDGALEDTEPSATLTTTTLTAYFAGDGASTFKLNGAIDTVYIYNDVRSGAEILSDWNNA